MRLGVTTKGRASKLIVIAGSIQGLAEAQAAYQRLTSSYPDLMRESAQYYRDYLSRTVNLTLPDAQLQQAYDWSRISTVQGLVTNATLGTGLGFMLPVSTPCNAIVYSSGRIPLRKMMAYGLLLDVVGVLVIIAAVHGIVPYVR